MAKREKKLQNKIRETLVCIGATFFFSFTLFSCSANGCTRGDMNESSSADMSERATDGENGGSNENGGNGGNGGGTVIPPFTPDVEGQKKPFQGTSDGYKDEKYYTYTLSLTGMKSMNWNPHTWQENNDKKVMQFTNIGFYDFVLDESGLSFVAVPEMAAYVPNSHRLYEDVTANYVNKFGVKEGERAKAFRIYLNPNATFDDEKNTPVTAADYLYSMQALLDPKMLNRRADSYYGGDFAVYNAKNYVYGENGVTDFSKVGLTVGKDEQSGLEYLDIILENRLVEPDFYLPYYCTSTWLVHKDIYEKNKIYYYADGTKSVGKQISGKTLSSIGSQYCTSLETSVGYGPYRLTGYGLDGYLRLTRNENWYGYKDGAHLGQFQADEIYYKVIEDHKTELLSFLNGDIDEVALSSADMETYGASSKAEYSPQDYTTKLTLNTDYEKLRARGKSDGVNKTVLTVPAFRRAISLCINRDEFASAYTAAGSAGYGLLNNMYVFDPLSGGAYRSTSDGKQALCKLYGMEYGLGEKYASLDEAYEAVTGYDISAARACMTEAYNYATTHDEKGNEVKTGAIYDGRMPVKIDMVVYSADETYVQMFNYLNSSVKAACKGTPFEGKVSLTMRTDQDYYSSAYAGNVDMMFSTWGGAVYNGLSVLSNVYCDDHKGGGNQMEYGFDTNKVSVTVELDLAGDLKYTSYTASLKTWADWLNNRNVTVYRTDKTGALPRASELAISLKTKVFSELEHAYLSAFTAIPLYYRNTVALRSEKTEAAAKTYVDTVGFGGVRFMTFRYDDGEWAKLDKGAIDYTK